MEGKTMILSVFIMSLVMAQIQVGAKSCCPNKIARAIYNACRAEGISIKTCASLSGCKIIEDGTECPHIYNGTVSSPPIYDHGILEKSVLTQGDAVNEYCKLGCASSVCGAITTLQNSDSSEIVNRAVEQCIKACSTFCTKGSMTTVETA